jgi:hypothetical protein
LGDTPRHKVFISYHSADKEFFKKFEGICENSIVNWSVDLGDIPDGTSTERTRQRIRDEYLRDSSVTLVLVGEKTWQRKHVDWEIGSSIRNTEYNPRSGLLGVILPSYPRSKPNEYNPYTIPPRLHYNVENGYALMYNWTDDPTLIQKWIHEAYLRKSKINPDNSYPSFVNNRSGDRWYN